VAPLISLSPVKPTPKFAPLALGYAGLVSPTILRVKGFRFISFPRGTTAHFTFSMRNGEAKFWIEPVVELAANFSSRQSRYGSSGTDFEEHLNENPRRWTKHSPAEVTTSHLTVLVVRGPRELFCVLQDFHVVPGASVREITNVQLSKSAPPV